MRTQAAIETIRERGENIREQIRILLERDPAITPREIQEELGLGKEVYYHLRKLGIKIKDSSVPIRVNHGLLKEKNKLIVRLRMENKNLRERSKTLEEQVLDLDEQLEAIDKRELLWDKEFIAQMVLRIQYSVYLYRKPVRFTSEEAIEVKKILKDLIGVNYPMAEAEEKEFQRFQKLQEREAAKRTAKIRKNLERAEKARQTKERNKEKKRIEFEGFKENFWRKKRK